MDSACQLDILAEQFPDNVSVSDLCDCGRHKRRKGRSLAQQRRSVPFPETDYASTYKAVQHPRPRSSKRPPPSPSRIPRSAPMSFQTNQRDEFKPTGVTERTKPIIPEENYVQASVPVEGTTSYTREFVPKQLLPEIRRVEPRNNYITTSARFDGQTTTKDHYKQWVSKPVVSFGELPSFTGSILYPKKETFPESCTKESFKGEFAPRPDAIRLAEANIKLEGDMFLTTTNKDTFKKIEGDHRAERVHEKTSLGKKPKKLGKFQDETQNRFDFPPYRSGQPMPAKLAEPAPTTIDLRFDNKQNFSTEQRSIYRGHDILKNPVAKPFVHDPQQYEPPTVKFETVTSNKHDYQPIDIERNTMIRVPPPVSKLHEKDVKFDGRTKYNEFFKNPGTTTRVRYGDFHENRPYMPPQVKFEASSITKSSFVPKKLDEPTRDFKPEHHLISTEGKQDFNTSYKDTYTKPLVKPCKAYIYLLQQELKRQREAQAQTQNQAISVK